MIWKLWQCVLFVPFWWCLATSSSSMVKSYIFKYFTSNLWHILQDLVCFASYICQMLWCVIFSMQYMFSIVCLLSWSYSWFRNLSFLFKNGYIPLYFTTVRTWSSFHTINLLYCVYNEPFVRKHYTIDQFIICIASLSHCNL